MVVRTLRGARHDRPRDRGAGTRLGGPFWRTAISGLGRGGQPRPTVGGACLPWFTMRELPPPEPGHRDRELRHLQHCRRGYTRQTIRCVSRHGRRMPGLPCRAPGFEHAADPDEPLGPHEGLRQGSACRGDLEITGGGSDRRNPALPIRTHLPWTGHGWRGARL